MTAAQQARRPAFLIVLVGTTDVQLLVREQAGKKLDLARISGRYSWALWELARKQQLHARFAITAKTDLHSREREAQGGRRGPFADWVEDQLQISSGFDPVHDDHGRLILVPAKVDGLVKVLQEEGFAIHTVVVCGTLQLAESEPAAASGHVVSAFLQTALLPDLPPGPVGPVRPQSVRRDAVQWLAVLKDEERPDGDDVVASFNEQAVDRVSTLFQQLASQARSEDQVILALGGGFPALKPIALEAARLQFGPQRVHPVIERQQSTDLRSDLRGPPRMSADLRLASRRQLCALVGNGQFLAAAQALEQYLATAPADRGRPWAVALQMLADLLAPREVRADAQRRRESVVCRLPVFSLLGRLRHAVEQSSVRTAINLESALRDGRIIEAVIATYTLQSQLIHDVCRARYSWVHWDFEDLQLFDRYNREFSSDQLAERGRREILPSKVKHASHKPWGRILNEVDSRVRQALLDWIAPSCVEGDRWIDFRNQFAHGRIDNGAVESAHDGAVAKHIWLDPDSHDNFHLLRHPLLATIFQHLLQSADIPDLAAFYNELIDTTQALLRQPDRPSA